ncbi:unnamed protein product [Prorocentrum cordatum]|uniref:HECT-type E3 ubiquitin transferase n=1 Tax=Prorocentrum cordatum TaxID=2364126 RepID=A0ABN9RTE1_9DINO|nr:unnamed protein product [Polarella glacialis]
MDGHDAADRRQAGIQHAQGRHAFAAGSGAYGASQINARGADGSVGAAAGAREQPVASGQSAEGGTAPARQSQHAAWVGQPMSAQTPTNRVSTSSWSEDERVAFVNHHTRGEAPQPLAPSPSQTQIGKWTPSSSAQGRQGSAAPSPSQTQISKGSQAPWARGRQGSAAPSPSQTQISKGSQASWRRRQGGHPGKQGGTPGATQAQAQAQASWTPEERIEYVRSLGIVTLPGEEVVLRFLSDALSKAPLPSPWHMARDSEGRIFFAQRSTGQSTWAHPLEAPLRELAGVCRMCLTFPTELRESTIAALLETWQSEAKQELAKWYSVKHENGREYFCHRETFESMWEHPAEVVLPTHYLKIRSIERLRGDGYLTSLRNRALGAAQEPPDALAVVSGAATPAAVASEAAPPEPKREVVKETPSTATSTPLGYDQQAMLPASPQAELQLSTGLTPMSMRPHGAVRRVSASSKSASPGATETPPQSEKAPQQLRLLRSELAEARQQHREELARCQDAALRRAEEAVVQQTQLLDLEEVRRDLKRRLSDAAADMAALQSELRHAESELGAAGTAHQRTSQLEAELQAERRTAEEQAADCRDLSAGLREALESVAEAERGKAFLEVRLAALYQDDATRDRLMGSQDDVSRAFLEAAYEEEVRRREKLLDLDGSYQAAQDLLREACARQAGLEFELEAAERGLRESRAIALDFKAFAAHTEAELEQERAQARKAQLAYEELAADHGASERQAAELEARLSQAEKELASIQSSGGELALLREQLAALSASNCEVQCEYEQAMQELSAACAAGDSTKDRALKAEAQLLADQRNFEQALEQVREAERARAALEAKLAVVEKGMEERDSLAERVQELQRELAEAVDSSKKLASDEAAADKASNDRTQQLEEQLGQALAKLQEAQESAQALSAQALAREQGWRLDSARLEELQAQLAEQAERTEAVLAAERQKVDLAEKRLLLSQAELDRAAAERDSLEASLQAASVANSAMAGLQTMLEREEERERQLSERAAAAEHQLAEERRNLERAELRLERMEQARADSKATQASQAEALAQERRGVAVLEAKLQAARAAEEAAEQARSELVALVQEEQRRRLAAAKETGRLQASLESQKEVSEQVRARLAQLERLQSESAEERINTQKEVAEQRMLLELAEFKLEESRHALAATSSERATVQVSLAQELERHTLLRGHAAELEERLSLEKRGAEALEQRLAGLESTSAQAEEDRNALAVRLAEEESLRASIDQSLQKQRAVSRRLSVGKPTEDLTKMLADEQEMHDQLQRQIGSMEAQLVQRSASLEAAQARLGEAEAAAREEAERLAARASAHAAEAATLESQLGQERRRVEALEQRLARHEADAETQRDERMRMVQRALDVAQLQAELTEERMRQEELSRQAALETDERVAGLQTELAEKQSCQEELSQRLAQAEADLAQARESAAEAALAQARGSTAIADANEERAPLPQHAAVPVKMVDQVFQESSTPARQDEQIVQRQQVQLKPAPGQDAELLAIRAELKEAREAEVETQRLAADVERQHEEERQRFERAWDCVRAAEQAKHALEERLQEVERSLAQNQGAAASSEELIRSLQGSLAEANQRQAQLSVKHDAMAASLVAAQAAQAQEESRRKKLSLDKSELEASRSSVQAALGEQRLRAEQLSARCLELEALSAQARAEAADAQARLAARRAEERSAESEGVVRRGQGAAAAQVEKVGLDLQALEASNSSAQAALDDERERARQLSSRCRELEQLSSNARAELAQVQERSAAYAATVAQGQDAAAAQADIQLEAMALDFKALEASKATAQKALDQERARATQLSSRCQELEQLCSQGESDLARAIADLAAAEARANRSSAQAIAPVEVKFQESALPRPSAFPAEEARADGGPETAHRELQMQVEQAVAAQERLREGLERAEAEVAASRGQGGAASESAAQAEAELIRERARAQALLERFQEAERARADLEARLAAAEQGSIGGPSSGAADVDSRIRSLQDELKAEQLRGALLLEAQRQLAEDPASGESLRSELAQRRLELEALRAQGDVALGRAMHAEAELQEERRRASAEASRAREAADAKVLLERHITLAEKDSAFRARDLRAAEMKLREQEQMLCQTHELERRLSSLEPKLKMLEQRQAGPQTAARDSARVAELEQQLAQATERQGQLKDELLAAEKKVSSTKRAQAALAEERVRQEKLQREAVKPSAGRHEALSAGSKLEAKLLELEGNFRNRQALPADDPDKGSSATAETSTTAALRVDAFTAGDVSKLLQADLAEKTAEAEPVQCSFRVENIDHQQLQEDRNLEAAFKATVKQMLATEAGGLVSKAHIRFVPTAGSVVQAFVEPIPGQDMGAVTRRLRSSRTLPKKMSAYISALDGIQRISSGPIKVTILSIVFGPEFKMLDGARPLSVASMSKTSLRGPEALKGGVDGTKTQAPWEPLASKFFKRLDRSGTGSVESFQVLQLWPLLSRQMDCSNAAALAAQLLQSTSVSGREWMALLKALHSIVGPKRLRRNLRSAEAYYRELRASAAPAAASAGAGPAGLPLEAKEGGAKADAARAALRDGALQAGDGGREACDHDGRLPTFLAARRGATAARRAARRQRLAALTAAFRTNASNHSSIHADATTSTDIGLNSSIQHIVIQISHARDTLGCAVLTGQCAHEFLANTLDRVGSDLGTAGTSVSGKAAAEQASEGFAAEGQDAVPPLATYFKLHAEVEKAAELAASTQANIRILLRVSRNAGTLSLFTIARRSGSFRLGVLPLLGKAPGVILMRLHDSVGRLLGLWEKLLSQLLDAIAQLLAPRLELLLVSLGQLIILDANQQLRGVDVQLLPERLRPDGGAQPQPPPLHLFSELGDQALLLDHLQRPLLETLHSTVKLAFEAAKLTVGHGHLVLQRRLFRGGRGLGQLTVPRCAQRLTRLGQQLRQRRMLFAGESIGGSASLGRRSCTTLATSTAGQSKATRRMCPQLVQGLGALVVFIAAGAIGDRCRWNRPLRSTAKAEAAATAFSAQSGTIPMTASAYPLRARQAGTPRSFRERLQKAECAAEVTSRVDWSRMSAVETSEAIEDISDAAFRLDINSGGQVFFALLRLPRAGDPAEAAAVPCQEEAIVIKTCDSRHMLLSEQMAAELARQLEIGGPASRLLLRQHDGPEWEQLAEASRALCPPLARALSRRQCQAVLAMQFVRGRSLAQEQRAWEPERLPGSARALGHLFVLDVLLGNSDRLPVKSLQWRGNPSNVLWRSADSARGEFSHCCMPIDAQVARRPPKMLVREADQHADRLLELVLLDRESARQVLDEAVSCNAAAAQALGADWAPTEKAWAARRRPEDAAPDTAPASSSAVKAFHEGVRAALNLAQRQLGLLEMVAGVLRSWIEEFQKDMSEFSAASESRLSKTRQLQSWNREANKNELVKDRLCSWQSLLQEKSLALRVAVDDWASRRGVHSALSFHGFLGDSVLNPIADAYELLVRLQQIISRARVMQNATLVTRACDLSPFPLLVGPVTACALHLLRKLGVTLIVNCTSDLPPPEELGKQMKWRRLVLEDVEDQDLSQSLEEGLRAIDEAVAAGGRVFVHCHEGKSRSVSVCLAYLVTRERRPLSEALSFIRERRPQVRPNAGFMRQMLALELATLGSNSIALADLPRGKPPLPSERKQQ